MCLFFQHVGTFTLSPRIQTAPQSSDHSFGSELAQKRQRNDVADTLQTYITDKASRAKNPQRPWEIFSFHSLAVHNGLRHEGKIFWQGWEVSVCYSYSVFRPVFERFGKLKRMESQHIVPEKSFYSPSNTRRGRLVRSTEILQLHNQAFIYNNFADHEIWLKDPEQSLNGTWRFNGIYSIWTCFFKRKV